jgi:hypothetical protein
MPVLLAALPDPAAPSGLRRSFSGITDASLKGLARLEALRRLNLYGVKMLAAVRQEFKQALPVYQII